MLELILVLNAIWFAMAFNVFALRGSIFAKLVIPKEHRDTPVLDTLIMSGKFLGGFNLAFCILNILLVITPETFDKNLQWAILLIVNAIAHGTQFAYNVPVALENRRGEGVWQVKGVMRFIFVNDFLMMTFNGVFAAYFFFR